MDFESLTKLNNDLRKKAKLLTPEQARFLVDNFYIQQDNRIRVNNQIRSMEGEPNELLQWISDNNHMYERHIQNALNQYVNNHDIGKWLIAQYGIGPILAAGLMAHIDISKCQTVAQIWSYAGYNPKQKWLGTAKVDAIYKENKDKPFDELLGVLATARGSKASNLLNMVERKVGSDASEKEKIKTLVAISAQPPFNGELKKLCWKIGQSFVKQSGNEKAFYGQLYKQEKANLVQQNENGDFTQAAEDKLKEFNIGKIN